MKKLFAAAVFCMMAVPAWAAVPVYVIDAKQSTLEFTATQNNAPVKGSFKNFSGEVKFDPANLKESEITVTVDVSSLDASYAEMKSNLLLPEWLDAKQFTQAMLKTYTIRPVGMEGKQFFADAELTIRGVTVPVQVNFTVERLDAEGAVAKGRIPVLRNKFGVGQGDWKKTDVVKDNVDINFRVTAVAKKP